MTTALELITRAMKLADILGEGQVPSGDQSVDALADLNELIDSMNADGLMIYRQADDPVATVANQDSYTVGIGGNWNVTRPIDIDAAYVVYQGISYPVTEITADQYSRIGLKTQAEPWPRHYLYINNFPLATVILWPVPSQALPMYLTVNTSLSAVALGTVLTLAPAYSMYLRATLAAILCPSYGREPSPSVVRMAAKAMADIKRANYVPGIASFDSAILGGQSNGFPQVLAGY